MKRGRILYFFVIKKIWSERSWFFSVFTFSTTQIFSLFSPDYLTFSQILILKILFIFHFFLLSRVFKYKGFKVLDRYFYLIYFAIQQQSKLYLCFGGRIKLDIIICALHSLHFLLFFKWRFCGWLPNCFGDFLGIFCPGYTILKNCLN